MKYSLMFPTELIARVILPYPDAVSGTSLYEAGRDAKEFKVTTADQAS